VAQRLNSGGGKAHAVELDVRSYRHSSVPLPRAAAIRRIDYLFNKAGIGVGGEVDSYTPGRASLRIRHVVSRS
jgi:NADP-dependent 3-hydroxy acid dehydrogenase YdfG